MAPCVFVQPIEAPHSTNPVKVGGELTPLAHSLTVHCVPAVGLDPSVNAAAATPDAAVTATGGIYLLPLPRGMVKENGVTAFGIFAIF